MKSKLLLITLICLVFGCTPKFDPNEEFVPVDVIYGAISPNNFENHFYIYDAFSAEQISEDGTIKDSSAIYSNDSLVFSITEIDKSDEQSNFYIMKSFSNDNLESDVFDFKYNKYYKFDTTEFKIQNGYKYKIRLENLKTQKTSYAEINSISNYTFIEPKINFQTVNGFSDGDLVSTPVILENEGDKNYFLEIDLYLIINLKKKLTFGGGLVQSDTLLMPLDNILNKSNSLPSKVYSKISFRGLFDFLSNKLDPVVDDDLWRSFSALQIRTTYYSEDMMEYLEAEAGFNSLSQYKPIYSNIRDEKSEDEQLGLFYSSLQKSINITLHDSTMQFLDTSKVYKDLGF